MRAQPPSNQAHDQQNDGTADNSHAFAYGQVISRPMHYGGSVTLMQHFFCIDADTAAIIALLAKTISFQEWEKKDTHVRDTHVWFQVGSNDVCVTKTPDGWLAHGPNDQTLTYLDPLENLPYGLNIWWRGRKKLNIEWSDAGRLSWFPTKQETGSAS